MSTDQPDSVLTSLPSMWTNVDDLLAVNANAFLIQGGALAADGSADPGSLIIGQVVFPAVLGSPEDQKAMFEALGSIPIRAMGRFTLTRGRAVELRDLLNDFIEKTDNFLRQQREPEAGGR